MELESDLSTLVLGDTATGLVGGTTTTSTKAAAATATTTTGTTTATSAKAATTTATAAAAAAVVGTGSAEVQADRAAIDLGTVQLVEGCASFLNRRKLDISEALGTARFGVGRQADAHDASLLTEDLVERILVSTEGDIADEESVALRAGLITERTGTSLSPVLEATLVPVGGTSGSVVKVDLATVDFGVLLSLKRLSGVDSIGVFDITESESVSTSS